MPNERNEPRRQQHRWILVVLAIGLAVTIALTLYSGTAQTFTLLFRANLVFVSGIVVFQTLRYVAMSISTRVVSEIVDVRVPFLPLFEAALAATAANRTFVGGAAGLVIKGAFLLRHGMPAGTFAGVEGIEDVVSLGAVSILFLSGLAFVAANGTGSAIRWDFIGIFLVGVVILVALVIMFIRRRALVERTADAIARAVNAVVGKILRRNLYHPEHVQKSIADFYGALALARRDPLRVFISFGCAFGRLGSDWIALYFAFHAIGSDVALGTVLLIFIVSTSVATLSIVPGQIGVMDAALAFLSTALGIPPPVAVSATLLYRLVSFWLPIPFGYAFAWHLERTQQI
jgi:glycosyltransferase 2 family protein